MSNTKTKRRRFILFALVYFTPAAVKAAGPDAGQLLNEQRRHPPEADRRIAAPNTAAKPEAPAAFAAAVNGLTVELRAVRFTGADGLASPHELQAVIAPAIGRALDHAALQQLATDVTLFLRARGYALVRAYLPRQDLTAGNLEIVVLDGRLQSGRDRVTVQGSTRIRSARLKAAALSALPEGALRVSDLERAVLLVNDLSGISARSALERGDAPGTSRLVIEATESDPFVGSISFDNFSNRATGSLRGTAQLAVLDPLRLGDSFGTAVSATSSTIVVGASYSVPLTPSGLRLNASGSYLHYSVEEELASLDLRGHAETVSLGLTYPLLRTRKSNLSVHFDCEEKRLQDDGLGVNLRQRRIEQGTFNLTGNHYDQVGGGGLTDAVLTLSSGQVDLSGNAADRIGDSATARTQGSFMKVSVQFSRLQSFGQFDGGNWSAYATFAGQWANTNLDSSEKFILGGPNGVRAYPVGEAAGDEGWLGSFELRRNLTLPRQTKAQVIGFVDTGSVWLNHRPWPGSISNLGHTNYVDLAGAGLGLNVWAGHWVFRAAFAQAINHNPGRTLQGRDADGRSSRQRAWLQTSLSF